MGEPIPILIDPFPKDCLLRGLDPMGCLLKRNAEISAHEAAWPLPAIDLGEAAGA